MLYKRLNQKGTDLQQRLDDVSGIIGKWSEVSNLQQFAIWQISGNSMFSTASVKQTLHTSSMFMWTLFHYGIFTCDIL